MIDIIKKILPLNLLRKLRDRNKVVCIQLTTKNLLLSLFKKHRTHLSLIQAEEVQLEDNVYRSGVCFNPSRINFIVSSFINKHHLSRPETIVSIPEAKTINPPNMAAFQLALCLKKTTTHLKCVTTDTFFQNNMNNDMRITKSSYRQLLQNDLLKFLKEYNESPGSRWIIATLCLALGILIPLCSLYIDSEKIIKKTSQSYAILAEETDTLAQKIRKLHKIQAETSKVQKKSQTVQYLSTNLHNPHKLLTIIAKSIPPQSFLTQLLVEKNEEQAAFDYQITLQGITLDINETPLFVSTLEKSHFFKSLTITLIKELEDSREKKKHYAFTINGILKEE